MEEDAKLVTPLASPPPPKEQQIQPPYTMLRKTAGREEFCFNASNLAQVWQSKGWGLNFPNNNFLIIIIKKRNDLT